VTARCPNLLQVNKGKFTAFLGFLVPKKYPAFLTADDYQIFSASEVFSQKIRTAARSPLAFSSAMEGDHAPYNCKNCFQKSTDRSISWARLLKHVFDVDVEYCPNCGGALKIIAAPSTRSGQASMIRR
jgi:Pyruvate/2-oxoacid:ferredoxin oxidoreductase delta subunit